MKDIVIIGSGGFAKEVVFLIEECNKTEKEWNILGFIDEEKDLIIGKHKVYETDEWLLNLNKEIYVVFGIGNPTLIKEIHLKLEINSNLIFPNIIHPNVVGDWEGIELGKGNLFCASNTLTTGIKIGDFNIFNLDCTIGHDSIFGSYNVINPSANISGGVEIADNVLIGTNVTILQYKKIFSNVIVGASSLVTKDIVEEGVYVGSPVVKIK
jgi:sugar O-acyltransferase (sialic acid O-acetyltransferase NeuD family)|tara:strand:+ start:180 stop:812 length:633 start_codon:yes stop_codon:yes gene_type:complete